MKRSIVQKWCIENEFELVELSPQQQDDDEDGKGQIYVQNLSLSYRI